MDLTDRDLLDLGTDDDRAAEMALTARLIVAANDSGTALERDEIDRILGVSPRSGLELGGEAFPAS